MVKYRLYALWSYLTCGMYSWGIRVWAFVHQKSFDRWFKNTYMEEFRRELEAKHGVRLK